MNDRLQLARFGRTPGLEYWQQRLEQECACTEHDGRPFALLLIEPDQDDAGDDGALPLSAGALGLLVEGLRRGIRANDVFCRLSPTSMGMLLMECDLARAPLAEKRLLTLVEKLLAESLPAGMLPPLRSGWAACPEDAATPDALVDRAQAMLHGELRRPTLVAPANPPAKPDGGLRGRFFGRRWMAPSHSAV